MITQDQLGKYFDKIGLNIDTFQALVRDDKKEALTQLYFAHVKSFPYNNFEIRKLAYQFIAKRERLTFYNHSAVLHDGGYCFQTNALLHSVLTYFDFDPIFCQARGILSEIVNDENKMKLPATHVVSVVSIGEERYLLEPAMGMLSPRYPILIRNSQESINQDNNEFRLYQQDSTVFVLERKLKNKWFVLFQSPLIESSRDSLNTSLLKLARSPGAISVRDEKIVVSVITDKGGKAIEWDASNKQLKFRLEEEGQFTSRDISFKEACELFDTEFSIKNISVERLKSYCRPLPKPSRAWEINLPVTERDLDLMAVNLTY